MSKYFFLVLFAILAFPIAFADVTTISAPTVTPCSLDDPTCNPQNPLGHYNVYFMWNFPKEDIPAEVIIHYYKVLAAVQCAQGPCPADCSTVNDGICGVCNPVAEADFDPDCPPICEEGEDMGWGICQQCPTTSDSVCVPCAPYSKQSVDTVHHGINVISYIDPDCVFGSRYVTGVNGFIDKSNSFGSLVGQGPYGQYVVFEVGAAYGGPHYGFIYKVITSGNVHQHPDNPDDPQDPGYHPKMPKGPVNNRTLTKVAGPVYLGCYASGHDNGFYVDETGIYHGPNNSAFALNLENVSHCPLACEKPNASEFYDNCPGWSTYLNDRIGEQCALYRWDFEAWTENELWNPTFGECILTVPASLDAMGYATQTIGRNYGTGEWWVGGNARRIFKWDDSQSQWVTLFGDESNPLPYPDLTGGHHDGLVVIRDKRGYYSLFVSDMTSDFILQYRLDPVSGNLLDNDPSQPYYAFEYDTGEPVNVEGMGFGPNDHIWVSSWSKGMLYELGGRELQLQIGGLFEVILVVPRIAEPGEEIQIVIRINGLEYELNEINLRITSPTLAIDEQIPIDIGNYTQVGQDSYEYYVSYTIPDNSLGHNIRVEVEVVADSSTRIIDDFAYISIVEPFLGFGVPETNLLVVILIAFTVVLVSGKFYSSKK